MTRPPLLARLRTPEALLAVLAALVFLGCLGSLDLWGKREQRAVAESIDTVDNGHWLVAQIQSRPRLEKPPLPRWTAAALVLLTGRRDEWLMRLPAALSALGVVGLVYGLGRRMGGRPLGIAAGLALCSLVFFIVEMRQAGNDGPLTFFVTLAIYTAWRRLHGGPGGEPPAPPADRPGSPRWSVAMHGALGLGFLCKGPIALLLVALALVPYLAATRRLKSGLSALASGWGALLLLALVLSWPVPVLLNDPRAFEVWMLEMGQKAGSAGITHHRWRGPLVTEWPGMGAPWSILVAITVVLLRPWRKGAHAPRPALALAWWWAVANLLMFCFWSVAKPNYFLPCLPAVALLTGAGWLELSRMARDATDRRTAVRARHVLLGHAVALVIVAAAAPVVVAFRWPEFFGWSVAASALVALGAIAGIVLWRRGEDALCLAPWTAAFAGVVLLAYGGLGPQLNPTQSHRALAARLARIVPEGHRVVLFYRELDEGLWYYLRGHTLKPVPGSQPRYNKGFDLQDEARERRVIWNDNLRIRAEARTLAKWLRLGQSESPYLLLKAEVFDRFQPEIGAFVQPLYREPSLGRGRNELMLLLIKPPAVALEPSAQAPR